MELFNNAKVVRLKSHHDKYLLADEDEEHVLQDRNGSTLNARWTVEFTESDTVLRLKSRYGRYLTASNEPYLLGVTGRKVLQTLPRRLDSSVEWEPVRDGFQVRLKTRYGHFLRANGGLPPWRNHITHDIPHRTATQDWVLWDVEIIELAPRSHHNAAPAVQSSFPSPSRPLPPPPPPVPDYEDDDELNKMQQPSSPSRGSPHKHKPDGRTIHYVVADDDGSTESSVELSFMFKGTSVEELAEKLKEVTGMSEEIIVCSRNPLNGNLCPLRLHLPPNNMTMHVVVVSSSSKVATSLV